MSESDEYLHFLKYALDVIWECYEKILLFDVSATKLCLEAEYYNKNNQDIQWLEYKNDYNSFKQTGVSYINEKRYALTMSEKLFETNSFDMLQMMYLKIYQVLYDKTNNIKSFSCYKDTNKNIESMLDKLNAETLSFDKDKNMTLKDFLTQIRHNVIAHQNFNQRNNKENKYYQIVNSNNYAIVGIKVINDIIEFILQELDIHWKQDVIFATIKYYHTDFLLSFMNDKVVVNPKILNALGQLDLSINLYDYMIKQMVSKKYIEIIYAICNSSSATINDDYIFIGLVGSKKYTLETKDKIEHYNLASDDQVNQFYAMINSGTEFKVIGRLTGSQTKLK